LRPFVLVLFERLCFLLFDPFFLSFLPAGAFTSEAGFIAACFLTALTPFRSSCHFRFDQLDVFWISLFAHL